MAPGCGFRMNGTRLLAFLQIVCSSAVPYPPVSAVVLQDPMIRNSWKLHIHLLRHMSKSVPVRKRIRQITEKGVYFDFGNRLTHKQFYITGIKEIKNPQQMTGNLAKVSIFLNVSLLHLQIFEGTGIYSLSRTSSPPSSLPRTRCIYHVIDLVMKGQKWKFTEFNLNAEELALVERLWDQLRAAVTAEDCTYDGITEAMQAVTDFILVSFFLHSKLLYLGRIH
jgi:hypothetical protein